MSSSQHSVAINSGFRNSGLTVSKTGKIITVSFEQKREKTSLWFLYQNV